MRRIFEDLIEEAHALAKEASGWNKKECVKQHMDEKWEGYKLAGGF